MTKSKVLKKIPQMRPISTFVFWSVIAAICAKLKLNWVMLRECGEKQIPNPESKDITIRFFAVNFNNVDVDWWNVYKSKLLKKCEFIT